MITDLPVDGIIGTIVSLIVIFAGINVFKDTINPLLGLAPDKALIDDIENFIMSYDKPLGIHDLMMHDYGPIIPSTGKSVINVSIKETSVANVVTTSFKLSCPAAFKDDESIFLPI